MKARLCWIGILVFLMENDLAIAVVQSYEGALSF